MDANDIMKIDTIFLIGFITAYNKNEQIRQEIFDTMLNKVYTVPHLFISL